MTTKQTLSRTDLDALQRALKWAQRAQRRETAKMLSDPLPPVGSAEWIRQGQLCASLAQSRGLGLKPWQAAPCDSRDVVTGGYAGHKHEVELRQRLRRAGLSLWEPDVVRALSEAESDGRNAVD